MQLALTAGGPGGSQSGRPRRAAAGPTVVDSSCWLEVFDGGARAALFEEAVARPQALVVPVITVYEVAKYLARVKGEAAARRQ